MAVFLSPGVFPREIDLSILPTAVGALTPAFIGTANKGLINEPTFVSNAQQAIDTFGEPFPESFLMYAVLAYFEEGSRAFILRVGVECETGQVDELADICIDTSGAREDGWGRVAVFTGIDFGRICTRVIDSDNPLVFHDAAFTDIDFNDADVNSTDGPTTATLVFSGTYEDVTDETFTVLITSDADNTSGTRLEGAGFQVIRNSDGEVLLEGSLVSAGGSPESSTTIDAGDGIEFTIEVDTAGGPLEENDTFTFSAQPDNKSFAFDVDNVGTFTTFAFSDGDEFDNATDFADAFNAIIGLGEDFKAIDQGDDTACIRTDIAGQMIQLFQSAGTDPGTEAWALEIGQVLWVFDIPRSFLQATDSGPFNITSDNNRVVIRAIGSTESTDIEFSVANGLGLSSTSVAASVNAGGIVAGDRFFTSFALIVPGGDRLVTIQTTVEHQFDQLQMLADTSHIKTLRFAEELEIPFPFTRPFRSFFDTRVILPETGSLDPATPLSCEIDALSDECARDTAYFADIVGFFVAKSPGTWIDDFRLTLAPLIEGGGAGDVAGRFRLIIEDTNNNQVDAVEDITFDPRDERYIANVINEGSPIGGTNGNSFVQWIARPSFLGNDPNDVDFFEVRVPGAINSRAFTGQANGIPLDAAFSSEIDRAIIGNPADESGIFAFQNPEVFDISLLLIPGASSGAVIGQGLQLAEGRGDLLFIVDGPFGLRTQQIVDWHNGMLFSDLTQAINSSFGALYHPHLKIFDQFNNGEIFVPPSGHVSAVYARTEEVAEQWFAPAGLRRGRILTALDTEVDLTIGERDLMYGFGNAVNPIVNFPQDGITVFGQRTLQRRQSALDRVNVRMLLIFIRKNATEFLRDFLFEPNDEVTRAQVVSVSTSFLEDIQARRGLTGFSVVSDERNNTPERIDRNELHVAYFLKPTRAIEFIVLNLVILRTEASFAAEEVLAAGGLVTPTA